MNEGRKKANLTTTTITVMMKKDRKASKMQERLQEMTVKAKHQNQDKRNETSKHQINQ